MSAPDDEVIRARQRRAGRVTALMLFAFVALTFLITIAKLTVNR